jgi:hypothetical protein
MGITVNGRQFDTNGKTVRPVTMYLQRSKVGIEREFAGDFTIHLDVGARTISISIPEEEWNKLITFGQNVPKVIPEGVTPCCTKYTPDQGCSNHGTLPVGYCTEHLILNCEDCNAAQVEN